MGIGNALVPSFKRGKTKLRSKPAPLLLFSTGVNKQNTLECGKFRGHCPTCHELLPLLLPPAWMPEETAWSAARCLTSRTKLKSNPYAMLHYPNMTIGEQHKKMLVDLIGNWRKPIFRQVQHIPVVMCYVRFHAGIVATRPTHLVPPSAQL